MIPFVVYADFECFVEKLSTNDTQEKNTSLIQQHKPYAVAFKVVCSFDESYSYYMSYTGPDSPKWFIQQLVKLTNLIVFIKQLFQYK